MHKQGFFIDKTKVSGFHPADMALYDASNPAARQYYWGLMNKALFQIGADAWWLDTTEPETEGRADNLLTTNKVAIGNGARHANEFPLMTTAAVYEGQRKASDQKRVFILSRSTYAGAQRNAAATWSGAAGSTRAATSAIGYTAAPNAPAASSTTAARSIRVPRASSCRSRSA